MQIDHVMSLSDAWHKGARGWDDQRRRDFANDPRNLLANPGQANSTRRSGNRSSLPPNVAYRCAFIVRMVKVKTDYQLSVSGRERGAAATGAAGLLSAVSAKEVDQAAPGLRRMRHRYVMRLAQQLIEQFLVADYGDQARRRIPCSDVRSSKPRPRPSRTPARSTASAGTSTTLASARVVAGSHGSVGSSSPKRAATS